MLRDCFEEAACAAIPGITSHSPGGAAAAAAKTGENEARMARGGRERAFARDAASS